MVLFLTEAKGGSNHGSFFHCHWIDYTDVDSVVFYVWCCMVSYVSTLEIPYLRVGGGCLLVECIVP